MANYLDDFAICLRVHDFSETSQIVGLLTRQYGLMPLIAKGVKRPQPKKGPGPISGPLDMLTSGEVVLIPPKASAELGTLTAWSINDHRPELRQSLPALNAGMLTAEMTLVMIQPADPHPGLYEEILATLDLAPTPHRARGLLAYAKTLLVATGYGPQFEACVQCGAPIVTDQDVRFVPAQGGLVCRNCVPTGAVVLIAGRIARALSRLPQPTAIRNAPPEKPAETSAMRIAMNILLNQIEFISGRSLKTRTFVMTDSF